MKEDEMLDLTNIKYYEISRTNPIIMKLYVSKRKRLYHYTNKEGANGILKSNKLWITHSNFLEDKKEIKYISVVLDGVLMYLKENKECYDVGVKGQFIIYEAIVNTLEALKETYKREVPIVDGGVFLFSLTENKNNKYLYENYCGADGTVLEFRNDIYDMFKGNKKVFINFCAKVEYNLGKQMTIIIEDINNLYSEVLNNLIKEKKAEYSEIIKTVKGVLFTKILNYSFFFKDYKFFKEEEYRVVFLVENDCNSELVKYRKKGDRDIPYIEVNFKKKSLIKS